MEISTFAQRNIWDTMNMLGLQPSLSGGYSAGNYANRFGAHISAPTVSGPKMHGDPMSISAKAPEVSNNNFGTIAGAVGQNIAGLIDLGGNIWGAHQYTKTVDDANKEAGQSNSSIRGHGYVMQNFKDRQQEESEVRSQNTTNTLKSAASGAAVGAGIGSIVPGIGTVAGGVVGGLFGAIGGLFGGARRRHKMRQMLREQRRAAIRTNEYNKDVAETGALQDEFNQEYGDQEDQMLFAENGKDMNGVFNSMVESGEVTVSRDGIGDIMLGGTKNKDSILHTTNDGEAILSHKGGFAERAIPHVLMQKDIFARINRNKGKDAEIAYNVEANNINKTKKALLDEADNQKIARHLNLLPKEDIRQVQYAEDGKDAIPKASIIPNITVAGLGTIAGLAQLIDATKQKVYKPNTYVRNPYENKALAQLDALRVNPYPIKNELIDAERRARYAIRNSGGLSAAQKYLANVATTANTQQNIADALFKIQNQNLAYKSDAATKRLAAGAQDATNMMTARRADDDAYMKGHAAKQQGIQLGYYNILNPLEQFVANEYKRQMYNGMLSLYQADIENSKNKKGGKG